MRTMSRLLVVEDDPDVAELVRHLFSRAGHEVTHASTGSAALREAYRRRPDLVVLDVGLPQLDGWEVLERLRDLTDVPVLMLTGQRQDRDKVRALRGGADDYLTKPFSNAELVARVDALLRRSGGSGSWTTEAYDDGVVRLDPVSHRAFVDGREVDLTRTEFRLLHALVRHAGAALTPTQLLAQAWDDPTGIGPNRVKFAVLRLRRKLGWQEPAASPLESVRGVGYRYRTPAGRGSAGHG
jgi:DNA-binding response OmpR family regulator